MARFNINFYSHSLCRDVSFHMFIPNDPRGVETEDKKMKTVFYLHGYTGCADYFWNLTDLAEKYHFAMVMPNGENSFYLDGEATGDKYCTYVGEELIQYIRKTFGLAMTKEDTFICGFSMGGFGALHTGLAYPETFGKIVAISSALIVNEIAQLQAGESNEVANYAYYTKCFGDLAVVRESVNNPEKLVKDIIMQKGQMPEIYMACGTEDFLLDKNREFHAFLESNNVKHCYYESKGIHDSVFWNEYFRKSAEWLFV